VENNGDGLPLEKAIQLYEIKHPTQTDKCIGEVVRAGGHGVGIHPSSYVSQPIYNDDLDKKLIVLGYQYQYSDILEKDYISINMGEVAKLCNDGKLDVERYVDCYHIDEQIGLNIFVNFIKEMDKANTYKSDLQHECICKSYY